MTEAVGKPVKVGEAEKEQAPGTQAVTVVSLLPSSVVPTKWELFLYGECGSIRTPCIACWLFFLIGWLFTIVFIAKCVTDGSDIFTFEELPVKSALEVQQWYAFEAARGENPSCKDEAHKEEEACVADEKCKWDSVRKECKDIELCPSPPPRPREESLYLERMPAWVGVVYEALDGGNILDEDILKLIEKYENELLTTVGGAKDQSGALAPWNENWCQLQYPMVGSATPRCTPSFSPLTLFQGNAHGREKIKQQVEDGFSYVGPLSCVCSDDPGLCSICNTDGTVKGDSATGLDLNSIPFHWPSEITSCLFGWFAKMAANAEAEANASNATNVSAMCAASGANWGAVAAGDASFLTHSIRSLCNKSASGLTMCQWSPPFTSSYCSSTGFFGPEDASGMVTGAEREAVLDNICNEDLDGWYNFRASVLPMKFNCKDKKAQFSRAFFFAGAPSDDPAEGENFTKGYVQARGGWYASASKLERQLEMGEGRGKLRIMMFSGATIIAQYLDILMVDGFLSICSLFLVWLYMYFSFENGFLASCAMFEIVFSLPVGMCIWTLIAQQKIFWYQMLVIYMILGIGADDAFIVWDAWLQSALEPPDISGSARTRFAWAYRRSFNAMMVTTATTCGSFIIGCASPLPQVQSFCVFAAIVVFVDWLFCVTFFASAVNVYERYFRGKQCFGCRKEGEAGQCCGPGCCYGCFRMCMTCGGKNWKLMPKPNPPGQPPEPRSLEKFFAGPVFRAYEKYAACFLAVWAVIVISMTVTAGVTLRTAQKPAPLGRDNIDAMRGLEILTNEFTFRGTPQVSVVFGIDEEKPVKSWDGTTASHQFGGSSASNLKKKQHQLELLALCRAPELGNDEHGTRCDDRTCLAFGRPTASVCEESAMAWSQGYSMPADVMCQGSRYCFMEDLAAFWASKQGDCMSQTEQASCTLGSCVWDGSRCYSARSSRDYPGLDEAEFTKLVTATLPPPMDSITEFESYMANKSDFLKANGRQYEADFYRSLTGLRLNTDKTDIMFAWISFNASFPRENTVDQANEWYDRWKKFKTRHAPSLGGYQTAELYVFMVTQNEMVQAAVMGIILSLVICYIVLLATTRNWWSATLGWLCVIMITATFLGIVPAVGWSLGENECIFMIATVGLSVDYTVHLLNAYNLVQKPTRAERVQGALAEMGISVANSAITTLLAAFILFFCGFFFFFQFGGFIFIVILLSILMSTNLLMPMLIMFGPERDQGKFLQGSTPRVHALDSE